MTSRYLLDDISSKVIRIAEFRDTVTLDWPDFLEFVAVTRAREDYKDVSRDYDSSRQPAANERL